MNLQQVSCWEKVEIVKVGLGVELLLVELFDGYETRLCSIGETRIVGTGRDLCI